MLRDTLQDAFNDVELQFKVMTQVINIMHGINAREVQSMFLVLSELDKVIDSYSTLLSASSSDDSSEDFPNIKSSTRTFENQPSVI